MGSWCAGVGLVWGRRLGPAVCAGTAAHHRSRRGWVLFLHVEQLICCHWSAFMEVALLRALRRAFGNHENSI